MVATVAVRRIEAKQHHVPGELVRRHAQVVPERRRLDLVDSGLDADLPEKALEHLRHLDVLRQHALRGEDRQLEGLVTLVEDAVRARLPAGLGQELLRLGRVEVVAAHGRVPRRERRQGGVDRCRVPAEDRLDEGVPVDRVVEGAPHAHILEDLAVQVQAEAECPERRARHHFDTRHAFELAHALYGNGADDVGLAALQHRDAGRRIGDVAEDDPGEGRPSAPVAVEPLEHDLAPDIPLLHHVGAGPDRMQLEGVAVLPDALRADDAARAMGQGGEEGRIGLVRRDGDRGIVDPLDRGDRVPERSVRGIALGVDLALDVEDDRVGVDGTAILEADTAAELEAPGEPVGGGRPLRRELWLDLHLVVEADEVVVDEEHSLVAGRVDGPDRRPCRVHRRDGDGLGIRQCSVLGRSRARRPQAREARDHERGQREAPESDRPSHGSDLLIGPLRYSTSA